MSDDASKIRRRQKNAEAVKRYRATEKGRANYNAYQRDVQKKAYAKAKGKP